MSGLVPCWKLMLGTQSVGFFLSFSSPLCYPLIFQNSPLACQWECFLVFGNFSFKTPVPGQISVPTLICLSFSLLYFFLPAFKTTRCLSGSLMSSSSIQKLFCGICSAFYILSMNLCGESGVSVLFFRHLRTAPET